MKITINEASEFLEKLKQLQNMELVNLSTEIPSCEMQQWKECAQKATNTPEIEKMHDLLNRWKALDKR